MCQVQVKSSPRFSGKAGITALYKPFMTLTRLLPRPKDRPEEEHEGVVCKGPCSECRASYFGKSECFCSAGPPSGLQAWSDGLDVGVTRCALMCVLPDRNKVQSLLPLVLRLRQHKYDDRKMVVQRSSLAEPCQKHDHNVDFDGASLLETKMNLGRMLLLGPWHIQNTAAKLNRLLGTMSQPP